MTPDETRMWETITSPLDHTAFPRLWSISFVQGKRWSIPAIYRGSNICRLEISRQCNSVDDTIQIISIIQAFPTVELLAIKVLTDSPVVLEHLTKYLNSAKLFKALEIKIDSSGHRVASLDIFRAVAPIRQPFSLVLRGMESLYQEGSIIRELVVPSLRSLRFERGGALSGGWYPHLPCAPSLQTLQIFDRKYLNSITFVEILPVLAGQQKQGPFQSLTWIHCNITQCIIDDYPQELLLLKHLQHLKLSTHTPIYVSEPFLLEIARANPQIETLELFQRPESQGSTISAKRFAKGPHIVTIYGVIRVASYCPRLRTLHLAFNAKVSTITTEDVSKPSSCSTITSPHPSLRELKPLLRRIDSVESVARLLREAFPLLRSVECNDSDSQWQMVNKFMRR